MAPGGKAPEDIGLEPQHQQPGKGRPAAQQGQCGKVAGAEIGDDQERGEEDAGGAKVAHQGQTQQAYPGEDHEQPQVPPAEQPLQGGGTGEDIEDLCDL